jgi:hypothetical protein
MDKTPKKGEIATKFQPPILGALVKWCYTGGYAYPSSFTGKWDGPAMTDGKREAEFHFRVFQAASELGMDDLKALAVRKLKVCIAGESETDDVAGWLLETSDSAKGRHAEPPMALIDTVTEMQARSVRNLINGNRGMSLDEAFHHAAKPVLSLYLIDFLQAVSEVTGVRLHNYLQCPDCACVIRSKHAVSNTITCTRGDCHAQDRLGRLVVKRD